MPSRSAARQRTARARAPLLLLCLLVGTPTLGAPQTREEWERSAAEAGRAGDPVAQARSTANAALLAQRGGEAARALFLAERGMAEARALPASPDRLETLVSVGATLAHLAGAGGPEAPAAAVAAHAALSLAASEAAAAGSLRLSSFAEGLLGTLYEGAGRDADAAEMTRRALLSAQAAGAPEALYRWQAQLARLERRAGRRAEALAASRSAVETLRQHRTEIDAGASEERFEDRIAPVYLALVDLLLEESGRATEAAPREALLREARATVEHFKVAELRDYYRDGCVEALEARARPLEEVSRSAAVLYPIALPDRLELLLSLPTGIQRFRVDVAAETLTREIRAARHALEKRSTREYLPRAKRLHERLVAPLLPALAEAKVDTLVWVPDGPLRTVPLAALHDGERFVIERFAVATTPGLLLTDPRPLDRPHLQLLLAGVSKPREGFPALPFVRAEIEKIGETFGGQVLLDEDFQAGGMVERLDAGSFDVVHIASHGEFAAEAGRSFVLSGDGRLALDDIEEAVSVTRFRQRPVELLSLTACETAADEPRSALGLAGVAVKAGARSALGTLWRVEDRATADLVSIFYRELSAPDISRAEALRRAQRALLSDPRTAHPGYWAPFLLISSWL